LNHLLQVVRVGGEGTGVVYEQKAATGVFTDNT
jgi:hypothetical protein